MLLTLSSLLSWLKSNALYLIIMVLMAIMLKNQHDEISTLKNSLESMQSFQTKSYENAKPVTEALLKSPKATKQMEKIAEKKPQLLEKRMNAGFQKLADQLQESTK
ncbi:hypothetical protein GHHBBDOD_00032 [Aeromonas phage avDM4]|nr:hypothetical protein GHHBBDOD_00032 [Aeromonas phage avDM4]